MRSGVLPDDVLIGTEFPSLVGSLAALDVPGFLQFHHSGPNGILALSIDPSQPRQGVIPIFREAQHLGQQALGLERQALVPQVIVAHDGVIVGALYSKNCHCIFTPNS